MPDEKLVADHYSHASLLDVIRAGIEKLGKSPDTVTLEDLGPVEEFHIGGRPASEAFLDQLALSASDRVLDVGCGLGGTSRFVAHRYKSQVRGVDLTNDYIETGKALCQWVGLADQVTLEQGSATALPFADASFDKAYMMHVGMNIADKQLLGTEIHRVLKPGATFGIYDVMRTGEGELVFPVPWASTAEGSVVATPAVYKEALETAGFQITAERNRREFALEFFANLLANNAAASGSPPLGIHLLMGQSTPVKAKNVLTNIENGRIAPVELIATKSS